MFDEIVCYKSGQPTCPQGDFGFFCISFRHKKSQLVNKLANIHCGKLDYIFVPLVKRSV